MIKTVSDFLEQFRQWALNKIQIADGNISHRPTIGNMYEGLTAGILNKAIFAGLDLRIVQNGFIYNDTGKLSNEIDCMLVLGNGQQISFTKQFKYHIRDVIAVFQVKKSLFGDDIEDSHQNLLSVIECRFSN